jgi:CRP-like cAMP-binding protein
MPTQLVSAETVSQIPLFAGLSLTDLDGLLSNFEERSYPADSVVFRKGEYDPALYVLLDGVVEVVLDVPGSEEAVIARLQSNDVFGESSFFCPAPHGALVRCVEPSVMLRLSRCAYERLIAAGSVPALRLGNKAAEILAARLQATDQWVAQLLAEEQQQVVASWRRFRESIGVGFELPHGFVHTT